MDAGDTRRIAVVTGGTGALGQWVVRALLEDGFTVQVPWIVESEAEALAAFERGSARGGAELTLARADLASPEGAEAYFGRIGEREGRLDVLCNLAGGFTAAPLEETEPAAWGRMMELNATTAFLCCRAAAPLMKATGGGRIVNVTALPALERGAAGMSAYAASKAAVLSLTHSLARELRRAGITVNALAPEILDTPANRAAMPDADPARWVHPREAARVVAFLAGAGGAVVTGSVMVLAQVGRED